jgi:hypothetical protein
MGITPTRTRTKNEYPPQSIKAGVAIPYWYIEIRDHFDDISVPFEKIVKQLSNKVDIINKLSSTLNLKVSFIITIHLEKSDYPLMRISKEITSFASSINAEITFDIYAN